MRAYVLAAMTAALFVLPNSAFSQAIDIGPGGIRVAPGYQHHRRTGDGQLPQVPRDLRLIRSRSAKARRSEV